MTDFPSKDELLRNLVIEQISRAFHNGCVIVPFKQQFSEEFITLLKSKGYDAQNSNFIDYSRNGDGTEIRECDCGYEEFSQDRRYRAIIDLRQKLQ